MYTKQEQTFIKSNNKRENQNFYSLYFLRLSFFLEDRNQKSKVGGYDEGAKTKRKLNEEIF